MTLESAEPHAGKHGTSSGENRDRRHLEQRVRGKSRTVPISPPLTELLNAHINAFGTGTGGRLFISERNKDELPVGAVHRIWRWTRSYVFTEEVAASALSRMPYDLRHAAVSTWLNGGVPATAQWGECRRLRLPSGPASPSRSCCGSTRSASTVSRRPCA
jgi:hypothetical protein